MVESRVNTYACKKATSSSNKLMKTVKATLNGLTAKPKLGFIFPKIKIRLKKPKMMMCPAVMLANNRSINTKGFKITPKISIGIIITYIQTGTSGIKMCFQ